MLKLIIETSVDLAEYISDFLTESGALAVSLQDSGDQPLFQEILNETPLWKKTQIQALFAEDVPLNQIISELETLLKLPVNYHIDTLAEEDWVRKTQQNFPPLCFADRIWVLPAWEAADSYSGIILRINPGLGFGTGSHPTTSLCLSWLAQQDLRRKTVIDYGCGSGILGLAALTLGAEKVWAVDHDPQALTATQNNAELNDFPAAALSIVLPEQLPPVHADIILANILANPLCELAPELMAHLAPGGQLVLSGFLVEELPRMIQAYQPPLHVVDTATQENWVKLILLR